MPPSRPSSSAITVGSTVRAPYLLPHPASASETSTSLPSASIPRLSCRALVLTIDDDGRGRPTTATMLYEDDPRVPASSEAGDDNASEASVPFEDLREVRIFERDGGNVTSGSWSERADSYKKCGDALLSPAASSSGGDGEGAHSLPDPFAALRYYVTALEAAGEASVGSTVLLGRRQITKEVRGDFDRKVELAEVDVIDEDEGTADVIFPLADGEGEEDEAVVSLKDIILVVPDDDDNRLMERILLNLARCLHHIASHRPPQQYGHGATTTTKNASLADMASASTTTSADCHEAAFLLCTAALELHRHLSSAIVENSTPILLLPPPKTATAGRYLRATSGLRLGRLRTASEDVGHVLAHHPGDRAVLSLRREVHRAVVAARKRDRQVTRDLCAWIDKATEDKKEMAPRNPRHVKQTPRAGEVHFGLDGEGEEAASVSSSSGLSSHRIRGYCILSPSLLRSATWDAPDWNWWRVMEKEAVVTLQRAQCGLSSFKVIRRRRIRNATLILVLLMSILAVRSWGRTWWNFAIEADVSLYDGASL